MRDGAIMTNEQLAVLMNSIHAGLVDALHACEEILISEGAETRDVVNPFTGRKVRENVPALDDLREKISIRKDHIETLAGGKRK
jgi:hypothetical protein